MRKENVAVKSIKFILIDIFADMGYFPIWWYTTGLKKAFLRMVSTIVQGNDELGVSVWIKNIFKPMFGQTDWQGRLISILMRIFQIIFRSILLVFWIIFALVVFFVWIILPIFLIFQIIYNLGLFDIL